MNSNLSKERLIKILLIVAIFTVALIGFNILNTLGGDFLSRVANAFRSVLYPFSIALILSFIVEPIAVMIDKKTFFNRTLSIITAIGIGILFVLTVLSFTVAFIVVQLDNILTILLSTLDSGIIEAILTQINVLIESWSHSINTQDLFELFQSGNFSLADISLFVVAAFEFLMNFTISLTHTIFTIVLTPVFMYFLIKDRSKIFAGMVSIFPKHWQPHLQALGDDSYKVIKGYFTGHGLVMLFITGFFIVTYSLMAIFIPNFSLYHALLFAIIMGLFSILPYLGVWISMAMPIVLLTTLHLEHGEGTYIYLIGIVMIFVLNIIEEIFESSLVQPNVFSRHVHIHPLAVLSSFIFFGGIFGLVGFILAVPIAGIIKAAYEHFKYDTSSNKT